MQLFTEGLMFPPESELPIQPPIANPRGVRDKKAVSKFVSSIRPSMRMSPQQLFRSVAMTTGYKACNMQQLREAVSNLRQPDYSIRQFHNDVVSALPEFAYLNMPESKVLDRKGEVTTSVEEYQRTMGSLFAVYWCMRLDMDGTIGFCFGVNSEWQPHYVPESLLVAPDQALDKWIANSPLSREAAADFQARVRLYQRTSWSLVTQLMVDAGLLRRASTRGHVVYTIEPERCVSIIVMLALQQLGKVCALHPTVEAEHAGWLGYEEGQTITHQMDAVRFMMEKYPHSLPSFEHLSVEQQRVCIFLRTRCELNPGWLIQAEAPPGKVFSQFKSVADLSGVTKADMSLYFVHWLTDMSSQGQPLQGSETFVKRFPQSVLERFIHSWNVVSLLAIQNETQVYERFLHQSWDELKLPNMLHRGSVPSVALMRLSMHGQTEHEKLAIIDAYFKCPLEVRRVLIDEMGNPGVEGQVCGAALLQLIRVPPFLSPAPPFSLLRELHTLLNAP